MTYRSYILAGLVAALGAPVSTFAIQYRNIGPDPQTSRETAQKHEAAMAQGASHHDANTYAARQGKAIDPQDAQAWSARHKAAMDRGASHLDASRSAGRL
jgi:hypothetical protein